MQRHVEVLRRGVRGLGKAAQQRGAGYRGEDWLRGAPCCGCLSRRECWAGADSPRWQALGYLMYDTDFVHKDQTVIRSCGESRERRGQQPERLSPSVTGS